MSTEKKLGRITKVSFGHGGYQQACIGINFSLGGKGWGVSNDKTAWDAYMIKCDKYCKWTEADRDKEYSEIVRFISKLLKEAKVHNVDDLLDIPVEVVFEGNQLKEWRILTEVI